MDCSVCVESFSTRNKRVSCSYCDFLVCTGCTKQYLLNSILDAHCMNCRKFWTYEFVSTLFSKNFMLGTFKKKREVILLEREKLLLLETQPHAEIYKKRQEIDHQEQYIRKLKKQYNVVNNMFRAYEYFFKKFPVLPPSAFVDQNTDSNDEEHIINLEAERCTLYARYQQIPSPHDDDQDEDHIREIISIKEQATRLHIKLLHCQTKIDFLRDVASKPDHIRDLMENMTKLRMQMITYSEQITFIRTKIGLLQRFIPRDDPSDEKDEQDKACFIKKCPNDECNGYLSTRWKCGLCKLRACSQCLEIRETEQEYQTRKKIGQKCTHQCKPENVETANLLKKDSKPCPTCSAMIYKISGCHQMFCTQCHAIFDWKTGKIETGRIHNPHYFDFLRENNGHIPRQPGDIPCGGVPHEDDLAIHLDAQIMGVDVEDEDELKEHIFLCVRLHHHMQANVVPHYQNEGLANNRDLRIAFLIKDISEDQFKVRLQQREKKRQKNNEITMLLDMFQTTTADIVNKILASKDTKAIQMYDKELRNLLTYFNSCSTSIRKRYNNATPYIDPESMIVSTEKAPKPVLPVLVRLDSDSDC